jgi:hypothetical protein
MDISWNTGSWISPQKSTIYSCHGESAPSNARMHPPTYFPTPFSLLKGHTNFLTAFLWQSQQHTRTKPVRTAQVHEGPLMVSNPTAESVVAGINTNICIPRTFSNGLGYIAEMGLAEKAGMSSISRQTSATFPFVPCSKPGWFCLPVWQMLICPRIWFSSLFLTAFTTILGHIVPSICHLTVLTSWNRDARVPLKRGSSPPVRIGFFGYVTTFYLVCCFCSLTRLNFVLMFPLCHIMVTGSQGFRSHSSYPSAYFRC